MNNSLTTAPTGPVAAPDEPADTMPADDDVSQGAMPAEPVVPPVSEEALPAVEPVVPVEPTIEPTPVVASMSTPDAPSVAGGDLESIKKDALTELRPLVDKLNLSPEDKFDTLLLIIRSTDDKSLVSQAHETAKSIEDDSRRAEALLDVIKEIDYFSGNGTPAA